jgi:AAHS family 4-hydroxybenzoate transporter-like MFS transporter
MTSRKAFDLTAVLEGQKLSGFGLRLVVVSWLVTFFDGYDMNVISFTAKRLMGEFHLSTVMYSQVYSAAVVGTILGGFLFGYIGDRVGRRPTIIISTALFSVLTLALAFANGFWSLLALRLLDGLALGGAMPLIWALNVEFAPRARRATIITLIMLGYGCGVLVAGPLSTFVLPRFDWPGVFVLGSVLSALATLLLIPTLPESLRFLTNKGDRPHAIRAILQRMNVASPDEPVSFVLTDEAPPSPQGFRVSMLFRGSLRWLTPLLWLSYFSSSISTFFLTSWGPSILQDLKFSEAHSAWLTAMNSLCSMTGGLLLMRFTDRHGPISIAVLPLTAVPLLLTAGLAPLGALGFLLLLIPISVFLGGSHYGVTSIISGFYPSEIRANGTGWCSGVAKIGSVLGPLIGGYILSPHVLPDVRLSYALLAVCPTAYGLAVLGIGLIERRERRRQAAAPRAEPAAAPAE